MATYAALAARQEHRSYFYVKIAGIPVVFGTIPGLTFSGYTYKATLKRQSISEQADRWDLKSGKGSGGGLAFELVNDDDFLTSLFATDLATMKQTRLAADLDYSSAGGETVTVESTTGWAAAGNVYRGLETITYTGKGGGGVTFTGCQRGAFDSMGTQHLLVGASEPESLGNPVCTSWPTEWAGRWVELYHGLLDEHGNTAASESLVFRGLLGEPEWGEGGLTVRLRALSLLSLFDREILSQEISTRTRQYPHDLTEIPFYYGDSGARNLALFYYLDQATTVDVDYSYVSGGTTYRVHDQATIAAGVYYDVDEILGCKAIRDDLGLYVWARAEQADDGVRVVIANNARTAAPDLHEITFEAIDFPPRVAEALGFPSNHLVGLGFQSEVVAENSPALSYHSATTRKIYVEDVDAIDVPTLPNGFNNCYILERDIGDGPEQEVVRVTDTGTDGPGDYAPGVEWIEVAQRGGQVDVAGSRALWSSPENGVPKVKRCVFMKNINFITALRYLIETCDGTTYNGDYDALPVGCGAAVPTAFLKTADWRAMAESGELRTYLIQNPTTIWDLLSVECALLGLQIYHDHGKIGIKPIGITNATDVAVALTRAHTQGLVPVMVRDTGMQVGAIRLSYNYDGAEGAFLNEGIFFQSVQATSFQRPASEIELEHYGIHSQERTLPDVQRAAEDLFARFALPPGMVELQLPLHKVLGVAVGDTISLTHARLMSPYSGSRGVSALMLYVYSLERNWKGYSAVIRGLFTRLAAAPAVIAPSAKVKTFTAHAGGDDELEIETAAFSSADIDFFAVGMKVKVVSAADEGDTHEGLITAMNPGIICMANPVLLGGVAPVAGDLVRFVDAADAALTAAQQAYGAIADYATGLIAGSDAANVYG